MQPTSMIRDPNGRESNNSGSRRGRPAPTSRWQNGSPIGRPAGRASTPRGVGGSLKKGGVLALFFWLVFSSIAAAAEDNWQRVQFREVDTLFANPGQGWMSQQRRPRTDSRFPCSVVYIRFNWADAEPVEGQYDYLKSRGWSFDAAVNFMLSNHVALINDNVGRVPPEAMPSLEKLARLAGYRFVLRELAHEKTVPRGATLNLRMKWANVGVGKLYRPFELRCSLRDSEGLTAFTSAPMADARDWLPGERDLTGSLPVPANLKPGNYTLAMALVDPNGNRRPLRLAIAAPEKEGYYEVSRVKLE